MLAYIIVFIFLKSLQCILRDLVCAIVGMKVIFNMRI